LAKNIPAAVVAKIDAAQQQPIILVELGLYGATLRNAGAKGNITFDGNVYTAKAMQISRISQSMEGQIGRVTVKLDNVTGDMSAYLATEDFYGKSLKIMRVYLGTLGVAANYIELFNGYMEEPENIGPQWLTVSATAGKPLEKHSLHDIFQRKCNRIFGDVGCNRNGYSDLSSTTMKLTVTSAVSVVGNSATTFADAGNLTQANDYWNFGSIEIVKSGVTHSRIVNDFSGTSNEIQVDVALPFTIDTSITSYTLRKGCPGTWNACSATDAWGPSSDNQDNFKGFLHIGGRTEGQ